MGFIFQKETLDLNSIFFLTNLLQNVILRGATLPTCPDDSTSEQCYFLCVNNHPALLLIYTSNVGFCLLRQTEWWCVRFCFRPHQPGRLCLEKLVGNSVLPTLLLTDWMYLLWYSTKVREKEGENKRSHMESVQCIFSYHEISGGKR